MIKYVDLTPEYGLPEYSADLFDREHERLLKSGGEQVDSITSKQIIEDGIGFISIRSAHSLTTLRVPYYAEKMQFEYTDTRGVQLAVPMYARFTKETDFVPNVMEDSSFLGIRKKVINRMFPIDFEDERVGRQYNIAFTEASVNTHLRPLQLLAAMERRIGPAVTILPAWTFTVAEVKDIVIK
jgi:hypothetical protein